MNLVFRQRLLTTTLLVGTSMLASPAFADAAQPAPQDQASVPATSAPPTGPVEAQPTPSTNAQGAPVTGRQEIVITGTRIPSPNLQSTAPVSVVTTQDIKLSGTSRVEDVLAQLPSAAASQSSGFSNGATGTAEIDLRYLGSKRTLTLVNGRRMTPGDPTSTSQAPDINMIPASLIKRVDVLTGGASSVYGADAVAGVVNFIMDTDFDGLRLDGTWSIYQHNNNDAGLAFGQTMRGILNAKNFPFPTGSATDGRSVDGTAAFGAGFDDGRGHVVGYFGYRKINPVLGANRDYSACSIGENSKHTANSCGGSPTANPANVLYWVPGQTTSSTIGALGPGTITRGKENIFNYGPLNYFQRPDERYTAGLFAHYDINPAIKPYLEFMFMDDHTVAQIAPSGDFGNTFTVNCDNPLLSGAQKNELCNNNANLINGFLGSFPLASGAGYNPNPGAAPINFFDARGNTYNEAYMQVLRRNVEGGNRQADLTHTSYRGVIGTRGDLNDVFSYDAYYQYGRTDYNQVYRNEFSATRLNNALNVVNVDAQGRTINPATGQLYPVGTPGTTVECRSVLSGSDPNCVPYDIFGANGPSQASINYLNVFGVMTGRTSEQIADVNVTGDLGKMGMQFPWANDGVGINVGYEYRRESLRLDPDQEFQTGDLTGQGSPTLPINGSFNVNELFGEVQVPIVQHSIFDELSVNAGYRRSWYKTSSGGSYNTNTYKISADFAPVRDIRFRAAYNRAVRAPNISELFAAQHVALDGGTDPCTSSALASAANPTGAVTATDYGCIAQGLRVGQGTPANPAAQYNGFVGGNPSLLPEKATTKTIGVVLQPRFIPRFAVTVDYWNIKISGAIQGFGADAILADCVAKSTATAAAPSCSLIHRDPSGSLWLTPNGFVTDLPHNVGGDQTDGIDVSAAYSHGLGHFGGLTASFQGTWVNHYKVDNGLTQPYDCVGLYGSTCGSTATAPVPKWRHKLRLTWATPLDGLGLSGQWRHQSGVTYEGYSTNPTLAGTHYVLGAKFPAYNYFDLGATYSLFHDAVSLRAGVNNIFDKKPPLVPSGGECPAGPCNNNTWVTAYDALGRFIYAGATVTFGHHPAPPPPPPVAPPPPPPPPAAPATQTCPDGSVILATATCPVPPPPPPPPAPAPERG
ncbi:MAG TPA: TonB-dependent receptor [Sphingomicrobium sp.]|nr:TonB-dependent receptor [Sphingomicrobium sp.]